MAQKNGLVCLWSPGDPDRLRENMTGTYGVMGGVSLRAAVFSYHKKTCGWTDVDLCRYFRKDRATIRRWQDVDCPPEVVEHMETLVLIIRSFDLWTLTQKAETIRKEIKDDNLDLENTIKILEDVVR